jgi:hypothetical protein
MLISYQLTREALHSLVISSLSLAADFCLQLPLYFHRDITHYCCELYVYCVERCVSGLWETRSGTRKEVRTSSERKRED